MDGEKLANSSFSIKPKGKKEKKKHEIYPKALTLRHVTDQ
jgi:hypothetical protein